MKLPCDRRSDDDLVGDLNAQLDDDLGGCIGLCVGVLWSLAFWGVVALVVLA